MGGASGVGRAGTFPAKYSFDISAAPSCANDFVVYTTSSSGNPGAAGTFASQVGTIVGSSTGSFTITNGARSVALSSSTTQNTGFFYLSVDGGSMTDAQRATNLANAIARNGGTVGVTASTSGSTVTVRALTYGTGGNSIVVAGNVGGIVFSQNLTGGAGTAGQPTIIAFRNLYSSCGTGPTIAVPTTYWSYVTGTGAFAETSPVISLDGTQVAFVQRTGTVASLVLLKWSGTVSVGNAGAPTAPSSVTLANYRSCTAPCMTVMTLSGSPNNTNSSPYYDYTSDVLYVGANNGTVHKFTGVFNGTPAESGAPWPVTVLAGTILSSPVYDSTSGLVFVGSQRSGTTGGHLYSINAAGTVVTSGQLAHDTSTGVSDSPIVDSTARRVYAFVGMDASSNTCGATDCRAIYQFRTDLSIAGLTSPKVVIGRGEATWVQYGGTFDNAYYTSATPATPTGNLYVCGSISGGSSARRPTLWRIPITANVMGAPVVGPQLTSNNDADCSPIMQVKNGANEYLFMSVNANGNDTGCTGACVYSYNLTGLTWNAAAVAAAGLPAAGGASGMVIDNISAVAGASQIYYSTLTSPGNAVQASQAGLN